MTDVQIIWNVVNTISKGRGHGVEVHYFTEPSKYRGFIVAFLPAFPWLQKTTDSFEVEILDPNADEFTNRNLNGTQIIDRLKSEFTFLIVNRKQPPSKITKNLVTILNA